MIYILELFNFIMKMIFSTNKPSINKVNNTEIRYIPPNDNSSQQQIFLYGNMIDRIKGATKCESCGGK